MEAHDVAATLDGLGGEQGVGVSGGSGSRWCKDCGIVVLEYHGRHVILVDGSVSARIPWQKCTMRGHQNVCLVSGFDDERRGRRVKPTVRHRGHLTDSTQRRRRAQ